MYSIKNHQFTPIYLARNISKIHCFFLCMLCIIFLSACQRNDSNPSFEENVTSIATQTVTLDNKPTSKPLPTPKPQAVTSADENISLQSAQTMLEAQIDSKKYNVSVITDDLQIGSTHYIAFQVNENFIPIEPVLLVNKESGSISCLSFDGTISNFSMYSITSKQQAQDSNKCDWNGLFYNNGSQGKLISSLQIIQNDASSFEFYLTTTNSTKPYTLAGIGHIIGNTAIFTDESDHCLIFTMNEDIINVYDENEDFTNAGLSVNGDYIFQSYDFDTNYAIGINNAAKLLKTLTTFQTKLPAPLSDYSLKTQDQRVIVKDRLCYAINVYTQLEGNDIPVTVFYVSEDGSVIFTFDDVSSSPCSIIALR